MLAAAIERKIFLPRGYYDLYPNLFVFIVGPSGIVKKSTSTGIAVQMLRDLGDVRVMSDRVTAGSLIDQLSSAQKREDSEEGVEHASMFIYASELIVFVKEVFGSVIELLTTFWDCPGVWSYKTKNSGSTTVRGVCLNMLAASTIQWLREGVTSQIMTAGFAGRVIFVCDKKGSGKWVAWPEPPPDHGVKRQKLLEDLAHIHSLKGKMKPTPEFKKRFETWYTDHMNSIAAINTDPRLNGYYGRKGEMILKIAMLRSISMSDSLELTPEHFEWGLKHIEILEPDLVDIYTPPKPSEEVERKHAIMDYIRVKNEKKMPVSLGQLRYKFGKDFSVFNVDIAIQDLVAEERILRMNDKKINDSELIFKLNTAISTAWD